MESVEDLVEWLKSKGFKHNKLINFWEYEIPDHSPVRVSDEALSHVEPETLSEVKAAVERTLADAGVG